MGKTLNVVEQAFELKKQNRSDGEQNNLIHIIKSIYANIII